MLRSFIQVVLIIFLIISILLIGAAFINDLWYNGFGIGKFFGSTFLCLTQMALFIAVCVTRKSRTLLIVFVINLVVIIILFVVKFHALANFIDIYRAKFDELIRKYPNGEAPEVADWDLIIPYVFIKEYGCCGVDSVNQLEDKHVPYFVQNFPLNCVVAQLGAKYNDNPHKYKPCINIAYSIHVVLKALLIAQLFVIVIILIVYGVYIYLCKREEDQRYASSTAGTIYPTVMDPSEKWMTNSTVNEKI